MIVDFIYGDVGRFCYLYESHYSQLDSILFLDVFRYVDEPNWLILLMQWCVAEDLQDEVIVLENYTL